MSNRYSTEHHKGRAGQRSETKTGKRLGMKQQPGSGAIQTAKGDLKNEDFLIECKTTTNDGYRLELGLLRKIKMEARDQERKPAMTITFVDGSGKPKPYGSFVIIEERLFKELLGGS